METILELKNVVKYFPIAAGGVIRKKYKTCKAVDDISFSVGKGQCFGIAGESGSGKTTLAKLILLLEKITSGSISFKGKEVHNLSSQDLMWYRSQIQTVFQDAGSSLSPRMRIKDIVSEPLQVHNERKLTSDEIIERTVKVLHNVGLGANILNRFPHELSGGQKQRVAIARAIVLEPTLVILDEPVSALDVSVRGQILNLLADLQEEHHLTYIIIAHDLAMLQHMSTDIAVMYLGKIVEMGDTEKVFTSPMHPYTRALLEAVPQPVPGRKKKIPAVSGEIGNPIDPPSGCRFHPRCSSCSIDGENSCRDLPPSLWEVKHGHFVACNLARLKGNIGTDYLHT